MRITSGKYKNRKILTSAKGLNVKNLRPSTERTREAIFNIIGSAAYLSENFLNNAKVLDIFCGCGALGLEAISRGAKTVTFIDIDPVHISLCKLNYEHICKDDPATFIVADASRLNAAKTEYNLIFLDPPYHHSEIIQDTLNSLIKGNWIAQDNLIIIEHGKKDDLQLPSGLTLLSYRLYGISALTICQFQTAKQ